MASGPIGEKLQEAGDLIDNEYDDLVGYVQILESTVKELSRRLDFVEQILSDNKLKGAPPHPPPSQDNNNSPLLVRRQASDETEAYSSDNEYKPQHPFLKAAEEKNNQHWTRRLNCWINQPKDKKAKQEKLIQEYYADKTSDKRREKIIKALIEMAKCEDKCKLGTKNCATEQELREFVMKRLEDAKFINKKRDTASVLTRRRAKTALKSPGGYDAKSFRV